MTSFDENEARRLDLLEKEIDLKAEILRGDVEATIAERDQLRRDRDADREQWLQREQLRDEKWDAHVANVEKANDHHAQVFDRIAAALEAIAKDRGGL